MFISKIRAVFSSKINDDQVDERGFPVTAEEKRVFLNPEEMTIFRQVVKTVIYVGISGYVDYRCVKALNKYCGDRYHQSAWMLLPNDFIAAKELCTTRDSDRRGKAVVMLLGSWTRLKLIDLAGKVARKWILS